jgi:hypothetical protein
VPDINKKAAMHQRWFWLIISCLLSLPAEESRLDRAKSDIHKDKPKPAAQTSASSSQGSGTHHSHHSASANSDDDDGDIISDLVEGIFWLFGQGIVSRFQWNYTPPIAVTGNATYPYAKDYAGYYAPYDRDQEHHFVGGAIYSEGNWIDDDLQIYALGGHVAFSAFTLRTDWNRYIEERSDGSHSTLNIGTIDAELALITESFARLNIGLGALILHDNYGTESGPAFVANLGVFPFKPLHLDAALTYGSVGEYNSDIMMARMTAGVLWQRYEGYVGWQFHRLASVTFDGPLAGIKFWF